MRHRACGAMGCGKLAQCLLYSKALTTGRRQMTKQEEVAALKQDWADLEAKWERLAQAGQRSEIVIVSEQAEKAWRRYAAARRELDARR